MGNARAATSAVGSISGAVSSTGFPSERVWCTRTLPHRRSCCRAGGPRSSSCSRRRSVTVPCGKESRRPGVSQSTVVEWIARAGMTVSLMFVTAPTVVGARDCAAVRVPFVMSSLEPAPGRFDAHYLHRYVERVESVGGHGVRVIVSAHQDGYGPPPLGL